MEKNSLLEAINGIFDELVIHICLYIVKKNIITLLGYLKF